MSASRGDSRAELGSSCSPVRNKSIARLSLREEEGGGCWAAAGSEKALSGSGQAGAARISRVSLGSRRQKCVCRGGGRGLPWLV